MFPMPQGSVRAVLAAKVDELVDITAKDLAEIREVTEQLHPERAHSCATAIELAELALDEIRERAHIRPGDEMGS
jgi:hypothetical protein